MSNITISRILRRYAESRSITRLHILEALHRRQRMDALTAIAKLTSPHLRNI